MNDVKDLCHRILDQPAPPMPDSTHVLTVARRAARRQVRITVTTGGLIAAAIVALTAAAGSPHTAPDAPRPVASLTTAADPSAPQAPTRQQAGPNAARIAQLLADSLRSDSTSDGPATRTRLIVSSDNGEGALSATVVTDDTAAPTGDLCTPAVAARLKTYTHDGDADCQVITVDGVPIRTTTGAASTATRFLADGFLTIGWNTTWPKPDGKGKNPPTTPPFTKQQLAELATSLQLPG